MAKTRKQSKDNPSPAVELPAAKRRNKDPLQASGSTEMAAEQQKKTKEVEKKGKTGVEKKKKRKTRETGAKTKEAEEREEKKRKVGDMKVDPSSPSSEKAPESSLDETALSEISGDGKGGEKSLAKPSDTTAKPSETTAEEEQETKAMSDEETEEDGSDEDVEAIRPCMHFLPDQYNKSVKVSTRCYVQEVVETFEKVGLTDREREWFKNHLQFSHIIDIPFRRHMIQPMWMLLLRTADIKRRKEYGIQKHALISGLDCKLLPADWSKKGSDALKKKYFDDGAKVLRTEVTKKFEAMAPDDTGHRLRMAVLYFLSSIIYYPSKTGKDANAMEDLFLSYVADLDLCQTFPWGRYSYDRMVENIKNTMNHYVGTATLPFVFPGFCILLELLAADMMEQGYIAAFEDMRAEDVMGQAATGVGKVPVAKKPVDKVLGAKILWARYPKPRKTVGKVPGAKKPIGKVPRAKKPTLDDVISAIETITEQLRLVMQQIDKMDGRLKRVEEDVSVLKGSL
ncbi:hypothetical protein N665_0780s0003 [Sinapis alba]|nr:hypothetical protein N665_0780s0003 [Sinapis alba]